MAQRVFKKVKKLTGGRKTFRKWTDWDEGDYIVGYYRGIHEDEKYGKDHFTFEIIEAHFQSDKKLAASILEKEFVCNTCGKLAKGMKKAVEGKPYQVTYNGVGEMEEGKYAGSEAYDVDVEEVSLDEESEDKELETDEDEDLL
jgi:hypothetical protein